MTSEDSDDLDSDPKDRLDIGLRAAFGPDPDVTDDEVGDFLRASGLVSCVAVSPLPLVAFESELATSGHLTNSESRDFPVRMGRYCILGEIARGGVGAVFRARDEKLRRNLAIKILLDAHQKKRAKTQAFAITPE